MAKAANIAAVCADRVVFRLAYAVCLRLLALSQGKYEVLLVTEDNPDLDRLDVPDGIHVHLPEPGSLVPEGAPTDWYGPATYWRLSLPDIVGDACRRIVYIDFDMAPVGSIAPLFDLDLGGRAVAAVTDSVVERVRRVSNDRAAWATRLNLLGLPSIDSYFNAGCLVIDAEAWRCAGVKAEFTVLSRKLGNALINADQDILNAYFNGRWAGLSPRWNFQEPSLGVGLEEAISPALLHFYGAPKPWLLPHADLKNGLCAPLAEIYNAAGWPGTLADVLARNSVVPLRTRMRAYKRKIFGFLPRYRLMSESVARAIDGVRLIRRIRKDVAAGRYIDVAQGISLLDEDKLTAAEERLVTKLGSLAPEPDQPDR